ncbi:B3 domain-containing protein Os01g0234100-like [Telopea speciosissima]|uniref:B3 domain-containing protein Os01g0234100-like n=1 Tax=Telopea speciosissima TaxID=54955 RepID=UPI001CC3B4AC|nr:B3 domain-containing protein Os01g0234100-like [Telopea speciosissima]
MEDQDDQRTLTHLFSKTQQQLPPPRILKQNERRERNPKLLRVRKGSSGPPPPRSSEHMQKVCECFDEANSYSMKKAKELQIKLAPEMPNFVKFMHRSHVSKPFWLRLPSDFCKLNLPKEDCSIILVDESGEEYETKYLATRVALSGGWMKFSKKHKLVEGDSVLFQLIKATKFKVYIIRENGLTNSEVAGDLALEKEILTGNSEDNEDSLPLSVRFQEFDQYDTPLGSVSNLGSPSGEQCANDSEEVGSADLGGIRLEKATKEFKDVKSFEDFTIIVNGLIIDSEFPEHVRVKYYELCCSQNSFLHDHLLEGINFKLIVGTISEIVNVADALRACKLTTSQNDFASWDKSLNAFEQLGMNVGFLHARLHQLVSLAFESEGAKVSKMYNEAVSKRACFVEEKRKLKVKIMELNKEIENLELKAKRHEVKFQAKVNDPW